MPKARASLPRGSLRGVPRRDSARVARAWGGETDYGGRCLQAVFERAQGVRRMMSSVSGARCVRARGENTARVSLFFSSCDRLLASRGGSALPVHTFLRGSGSLKSPPRTVVLARFRKHRLWHTSELFLPRSHLKYNTYLRLWIHYLWRKPQDLLRLHQAFTGKAQF